MRQDRFAAFHAALEDVLTQAAKHGEISSLTLKEVRQQEPTEIGAPTQYRRIVRAHATVRLHVVAEATIG